jgi:hypothetical protein
LEIALAKKSLIGETLFLKKNYPIINIVSRINNKVIIPAPDYKRGLIWDNRQQSRFVESILLGLPIPSFFFEFNDEGKWLAIDGTQRLMTIKRLFDNRLILSSLQFLKEIEKHSFDDLPDNCKHKLEDYSIETVLVDWDTSEEMKSALLERLNISGANISSQELRNYLYRKTSFPLLRWLRQHIEDKTSIIFPCVKKSQARIDEFILCLLSFYFVSEKKYELGRAELDHLMRLIENEDHKKLIRWFADQCAKIDSAFENNGGIRVFYHHTDNYRADNILTSYLLKNHLKKNHFNLKEFLVLFGVACSLSGEKFQKNIHRITDALKNTAKITNLFERVHYIMKGLDE